MSRAATQLAGNASSIFQAWLDLKQQTERSVRNDATPGQGMPGSAQFTPTWCTTGCTHESTDSPGQHSPVHKDDQRSLPAFQTCYTVRPLKT